MIMDITELNIDELKNKLLNKEFSVTELVNKYLAKIKADNTSNKPLNAITHVMENEALNMAKEADSLIDKGKDLQLLGIPIIIKDNINIKGQQTTCASAILKGYKASFDAGVIKRLKKAGAIFLAKSNMDEFAMGSSSEHSIYGAVRNYKDRDCIAGGSSGGSASAISAKFAPIALGSDTGGSIRQPASLCGVVGLKPTYGRVSRFGLVSYSSSLDQIGVFSNCVRDSALLLAVISGHDNNDSTSVDVDVPNYLDAIDKDITDMRIGIPKEYFSQDLNPNIKDCVYRAVDRLSDLGCKIVNISLPHTEYGIPAYYLIATSEASSNLSRFDGIRYGRRSEGSDLLDTFFKSRSEGFASEVKRRIILGTYALSSGYYDAYYLKAQKVRTLIKRDFVNAFNDVDVIISPTSPTTAIKIGEKVNNPLDMYLMDIFTVNVNLAGLPGISIPFGEDDSGLPIGVQLIGNYFKEKTILNTAYHLENR